MYKLFTPVSFLLLIYRVFYWFWYRNLVYRNTKLITTMINILGYQTFHECDFSYRLWFRTMSLCIENNSISIPSSKEFRSRLFRRVLYVPKRKLTVTYLFSWGAMKVLVSGCTYIFIRKKFGLCQKWIVMMFQSFFSHLTTFLLL